MWDPATERWTTMASAQTPRLYHSTALLLPDGRVFTSGGNNYPQVELYSPPYLFAGARPTIISAPADVVPGQSFFVGTPDAAGIARVTWIRLGSVTHAFDMNQRFSALGFSQAAGGLNVVPPLDTNLAPRGHYMLFVLNGNGVPSVAKIVRLQSGTGSSALAGAGVASSAMVNLTTTGTSDWAKWPNYIHKAGGGAQIANYAMIGAVGATNYSDDPRTVTWSDGTPSALGADQAGVYVGGIGNGFQITAPAGTASRTLYVYVGGWNSGGRLVAHLSDNSVPDYVNASYSSSGQYDAVYTLTYRTALEGQQLVVKWTQASGGGNVTLQGAALSGTGSSALAGAGVASSAMVNLTTTGTSDWVKWPNYIHKAAGGAQIANYAMIGAVGATNYSNDPRTVTWSDGTPSASGADQAGVYVGGIGNGFQITAPAGTASRTLYIYVGGWNSGGRLVAHLSDNSVPDYIDATYSSSGQYDAVYTLTYRTALEGQQLVVKWTQASGGGNVTLQGAALQ